MATFVQAEEGRINNGLLPPWKELLLEIQVHKLIQEFLFPSNAEEMCTSLRGDATKHKQEKCMVLVRTACNAPCVKSSTDKQSPLNPRGKPTSQAPSALHSLTCTEDYDVHENADPRTTGSPLLVASSTAMSSMEGEGKVMHKTAHLSRVGTFPCADSVYLQVGMLTKAKVEIKASCKKPPRPPKVPKAEPSLSLTRCCSDNGAHVQSTRRERRRKATGMATSNIYSSVLALLFTLCFAIIMIFQGFGSQGGQNSSAYSSNAFSPTRTFMRSSPKRPPEEASLAGLAEEEASREGVLAEDMLAQFYGTRKALLQPLPDTKSSEHNTSPPL